jgi:hypothetical protein
MHELFEILDLERFEQDGESVLPRKAFLFRGQGCSAQRVEMWLCSRMDGASNKTPQRKTPQRDTSRCGVSNGLQVQSY